MGESKHEPPVHQPQHSKQDVEKGKEVNAHGFNEVQWQNLAKSKRKRIHAQMRNRNVDDTTNKENLTQASEADRGCRGVLVTVAVVGGIINLAGSTRRTIVGKVGL